MRTLEIRTIDTYPVYDVLRKDGTCTAERIAYILRMPWMMLDTALNHLIKIGKIEKILVDGKALYRIA